jgi:hypothetical protein
MRSTSGQLELESRLADPFSASTKIRIPFPSFVRPMTVVWLLKTPLDTCVQPNERVDSVVRKDSSRQDQTRQDQTRQDKTTKDKTTKDKARQDKTRQGKARQDKRRQGETRQKSKTINARQYNARERGAHRTNEFHGFIR